jgi:hypothetical protein
MSLTTVLASYILVSEDAATKITILVALVLWLSLLRSYEIVRRVTLFLAEKLGGGGYVPDSNIVMQNYSTSVTVAAITAQVLTEERAPEGVLGRILNDYVLVSNVHLPTSAAVPSSNLRRRWRGALGMLRRNPAKLSAVIGTGVFYFSLALSYQLLAIFTGRIVGDNTARSNNPQSGAWFPDVLDKTHMVNTSIFPIVNDFQTDLVFKAIAYTESCYKEEYRDEECSLFHTPNIEYDERHNASCPFEKHMCLRDSNDTYELDTGWKSASILGINEKHTSQFRMRKICSPLELDGYFYTEVVDDTGTRYVEYLLGDGWGTTKQGNKTFGELVRDPERWQNDPAQYIIR